MTATNINIEEFINILVSIKNNGSKMIDLDMLPDETHPSMNKLVIHAVKTPNGQEPDKTIIRNPNINSDNNEIFDSFKDLL